MRAIILLAALSLPACKTPGAVDIRQVRTPTAAACVDIAKVPPEPPEVNEQLNGNAKHDILIIAPSALELRKYGRTLRALITGCETIGAYHD